MDNAKSEPRRSATGSRRSFAPDDPPSEAVFVVISSASPRVREGDGGERGPTGGADAGRAAERGESGSIMVRFSER